ncbi:MAG TPA: hypothetical protein EYN54_14355 [Methylococcaceae bacterium]|nr:hypothetical protein [Methylococcaceae bacterium]
MKHILIALLLIGCGGGSSSNEPEPVIVTPTINKCITLSIVHISTNPSEWVSLTGLYSLTYSGDIPEQRNDYSGTDTTIVSIKTQGYTTTDFYTNNGYLFTVDDDTNNINLSVKYEELHGKMVLHTFDFDMECEL